ncbi:MAG: hypothetical protein JNJ98_14645, partial [Gemmatimonadetes bacterium]|nr:hypothetical protein [Gemmatimonadota bacterium]
MPRTRPFAVACCALLGASTLAAQAATTPSIEQLQSVASAIGASEAPVWSAEGTRLIYIGSDGVLASMAV